MFKMKSHVDRYEDMEIEIRNFLATRDLDISKTQNARWLDQKCAADVSTIVADCILQYSKDKPNTSFSSIDIWHNKYTVDNVLDIFKKPDPNAEVARNEYDKFFQQPMEMLSYAGILEKIKVAGRNLYAIQNNDLLEFMALRERNSLLFLTVYIEKVLKDSGLWNAFESFFSSQTKDAYQELKSKFSTFIIQNTRIKGETECNRIFIKVLNPLAYKFNARGTERGHLSKDKITFDMLMYNRDNLRDIHSGKPKGITRKEHEPGYKETISKKAYYEYILNKAKRVVKDYNLKFRKGLTEYEPERNLLEQATHVHHIFPAVDFPEISHCTENLIALTPSQHLNHAHRLGVTTSVDKSFQHLLLLAKIGSIKEHLSDSTQKRKIYDFHAMLDVLHTGLNSNAFDDICEGDFDAVVHQINLACNQ